MESDLLNRKNLTLLTYVALILYISLRPAVPSNLLQYIQHPIFKLLLVLLVIYFSKNDIVIAVLLLLAYIITYLSCTTEKFTDLSVNVKVALNKDVRNPITITTSYNSDISKELLNLETKYNKKVTDIQIPQGTKVEFATCNKKKQIPGGNNFIKIKRDITIKNKCNESKSDVGTIGKTIIMIDSTAKSTSNVTNIQTQNVGSYSQTTGVKNIGGINTTVSYQSNYEYKPIDRNWSSSTVS